MRASPVSRLAGGAVVLLFILAVPALFAQTRQEHVYSTAEAKQHVGEYASVVGVVEQVSSSRSGTQFLNLDGKFPHAPFTVVVFGSDAEKVGDLAQYEGKRVTVTGKITMYHGGPEIVVKKPGELKATP